VKRSSSYTHPVRDARTWSICARCAASLLVLAQTIEPVHDLKVERFYTPSVINGQKNDADGPIKTFTLRGIKDSQPYLHDGRLLTLEDTVEFFNLVLQLKLTAPEKNALRWWLTCGSCKRRVGSKERHYLCICCSSMPRAHVVSARQAADRAAP
jgi:hypothetical protein